VAFEAYMQGMADGGRKRWEDLSTWLVTSSGTQGVLLYFALVTIRLKLSILQYGTAGTDATNTIRTTGQRRGSLGRVGNCPHSSMGRSDFGKNSIVFQDIC
ncbi:uncharacterized protein A1O5_05479, partial [Cladophialophora psammophila CBS 110553]